MYIFQPLFILLQLLIYDGKYKPVGWESLGNSDIEEDELGDSVKAIDSVFKNALI